MDGNQFDRLTRVIGAGATRRGILAALAALAPPGARDLTAWAKKGHHKHKKPKKCKHCGPCQQCKKGKCKPKKDGTSCAGGTCRKGVCAGDCTTTGDNGYTLSTTTETTFQGKSLLAEQTAQPIGESGEQSTHLAITLGGEAVLGISTETSGRAVTVTVSYGAAFQGIGQAQFTNDGETVTGAIDGRAIVPLAVDDDPSRTQFADGGAPPDVQVDPKLVEAINGLLRQARKQAEACDPDARRGQVSNASHDKAGHGKKAHGKGRRGPRAHGDSAQGKASPRSHPENSLTCLALYIPCETGSVGCIAGVASGCAGSLFFYGVCFAIGLGLCLVAFERCRRNIRHNAPCCPVACGGDPENLIFGSDPSCCEKGETCLDPNSDTSGCCPAGTYSCHGLSCCQNGETCSPDGLCCPAGKSSCAGVCCSDGACSGGDFCCEPPYGAPCGSQCCGPFSSCCGGQCCAGTCCNGACCNGVCNGGTCCPSGTAPCGSGCCATVCCNGACCPSGYDCLNGACVLVCSPGQTPCHGQCCPPGKDCYQCPNGAHICASAPCIN